jgi:ATP-dependent protease HslVU (ClpYQ) peptidase subunit
MTCIVGLEQDGKVYIGGDSAGVSGTNLCVRADEKLFRNGPFIIGFTTSFRMGQLLRYKLCPPVHPEEMNVDEFMTTIFIDEVRRCLRNGGYARRKEEQESAGTFMIGYRGKLFVIESDYQVGRAVDGIGAVGSGAQVAIGALHAQTATTALNCGLCATSQCNLTAESKVRIALEAAERWNSAVRSPFVILSD